MCDVNQYSQQLQTLFFLLLIRIIKVALYIYLVSNQVKTWQKIEAEKNCSCSNNLNGFIVGWIVAAFDCINLYRVIKWDAATELH